MSPPRHARRPPLQSMLFAFIEILSAVFEMRKEVERIRNAGATHSNA